MTSNPPTLSSSVIPAIAGIQRSASARRLTPFLSSLSPLGRSSLFVLCTALIVLLFLHTSFAADAPQTAVESPQLQKCLKRADDLPDMAALEAAVWIKKNGGNDAHLCRAFAQANRGMHADSAREFWALASAYEKQNPANALLMHNFSGQEFLRAKDSKNALAQYNAALKIAPANVTALTGRAETVMLSERFWDAIADLNQALKANPDDIAALRQRGRAWQKLGNDKNAEEDLRRAAALSENQK